MFSSVECRPLLDYLQLTYCVAYNVCYHFETTCCMLSRHELSATRNPKNKELEVDNRSVVRLETTSVLSG